MKSADQPGDNDVKKPASSDVSFFLNDSIEYRLNICSHENESTSGHSGRDLSFSGWI